MTLRATRATSISLHCCPECTIRPTSARDTKLTANMTRPVRQKGLLNLEQPGFPPTHGRDHFPDGANALLLPCHFGGLIRYGPLDFAAQDCTAIVQLLQGYSHSRASRERLLMHEPEPSRRSQFSAQLSLRNPVGWQDAHTQKTSVFEWREDPCHLEPPKWRPRREKGALVE